MRHDGYSILASVVRVALPAEAYLTLLTAGNLSFDDSGEVTTLHESGESKVSPAMLVARIRRGDDVNFLMWTAGRRDVVCRSRRVQGYWLREVSIGHMAGEAAPMLTALRAAFRAAADSTFLVIDTDAEAEETEWVVLFDGDTGALKGWPDLLAGPLSRLDRLVALAACREYVSPHGVILGTGHISLSD